MDIVTGGGGFIGKHMVAALKKRGREVISFDFPDCDIRKPLLMHKVDTIYHFAGLSNIVPSVSNPRDYYETNVTGTFNLLEAARLAGVKKFVYAASSGCYGKYPKYSLDDKTEEMKCLPFTETDPCDPAQPYALTKYMGEQLVVHYGKVYGMEVASLRIFNAYGLGCLTKTTCPSMLNIFLAQKANNKPLTIVGDGTQSRDWVYVEDVVEAFMLVGQTDAPGQRTGIYNLGTGVPTSVNRIAEIIGGDRVHVPERGGEPHTIYADNSRIHSLGWRPRVSIEEGLALMMENLDYWKNEKVFTADGIQQETKAWTKHLRA